MTVIVMKFGGSSVSDGRTIRQVAALIGERTEQRPVVIVSAHAGVTDALLALGHSAVKGEASTAAIAQRHRAVLAELDLPPNLLDPLLLELADFARGLDLIMVVEEKRSLIETQVKEQLFHAEHRPMVLGKRDETDDKRSWLFQAKGALEPALAAADAEAREVLERAAVADVDAQPVKEAWNLLAAAVRRRLAHRRGVTDPEMIRADRDARLLLEHLEEPDVAESAAQELLGWLHATSEGDG